MADRGSNKHGPQLDDELKREVEGTVRAGHGTRAEEWRDPEPQAEDQPEVDLAPGQTLTGGTPPGMTPADVALRADIARYIGKEVYPAGRDDLLRVMADRHAPERLIQQVNALPGSRRFANVNEVAKALGLHVERQRF